MRPNLVAVLLVVGIVVLGGGSVLAATAPTWRPSHMTRTAARTAPKSRVAQRSVAKRPATPSASTATAPPITLVRSTSARRASSRSVPRREVNARSSSITYTVKPGDTLSGIAQWFKLHGYGSLYAANRAVIGSDPNLIFAGEQITIRHGVMTLSRPSRHAG